ELTAAAARPDAPFVCSQDQESLGSPLLPYQFVDRIVALAERPSPVQHVPASSIPLQIGEPQKLKGIGRAWTAWTDGGPRVTANAALGAYRRRSRPRTAAQDIAPRDR